MHIITYNPTLRYEFEEMLVEYFSDDLDSGIPEDILRAKLLPHILGYVQSGVTQLAICIEEGKPAGFSLYQIDCPESDWCKRPGWGCIREFYIAPSYRHKGFGAALAAYSEKHLRALGAERLYLTSDDAAAFWEYCGYSNTHEICSNDLEILTK